MINYLMKKWQKLSDKMFEVAKLGRPSKLPPIAHAPPRQNEVCDDLEIHVPPECTVKANFVIHQVKLVLTLEQTSRVSVVAVLNVAAAAVALIRRRSN